jgi:hypothetical protein
MAAPPQQTGNEKFVPAALHSHGAKYFDASGAYENVFTLSHFSIINESRINVNI